MTQQPFVKDMNNTVEGNDSLSVFQKQVLQLMTLYFANPSTQVSPQEIKPACDAIRNSVFELLNMDYQQGLTPAYPSQSLSCTPASIPASPAPAPVQAPVKKSSMPSSSQESFAQELISRETVEKKPWKVINIGSGEEYRDEQTGQVTHYDANNTRFPDYILCLEPECLKKNIRLKTLTKHLISIHNLTPYQYKIKHNLPKDYPMACTSYHENQLRILQKAAAAWNKKRMQLKKMEASKKNGKK